MSKDPDNPEAMEQAPTQQSDQTRRREQILATHPRLTVTEEGAERWEQLAAMVQQPARPPHLAGAMELANRWGRLMEGTLGDATDMAPDQIATKINDMAAVCLDDAVDLHSSPPSGTLPAMAVGLLGDTWIYGPALLAWAKGPNSPWNSQQS